MFKPDLRLAPIAVPLTILAGCYGPTPRAATDPLATVEVRDTSGEKRGTAEISRDGGGLLLIVQVAGMAVNKVHGAHLHTTGRCEAPGFTSAGAHLNPGTRAHGKDNPSGSHLGDLPNLHVGQAGAGFLSVRLPGDPEAVLEQLFDGDGTALVIHADADDYRTDPTGNSGARIACGVFAP